MCACDSSVPSVPVLSASQVLAYELRRRPKRNLPNDILQIYEDSVPFPVKTEDERKLPEVLHQDFPERRGLACQCAVRSYICQETSSLKSCLKRDSLGPRLGVRWSNAEVCKKYLDPASFYYPEPLPRCPPRARRHQVPRKPITGGAEGECEAKLLPFPGWGPHFHPRRNAGAR